MQTSCSASVDPLQGSCTLLAAATSVNEQSVPCKALSLPRKGLLKSNPRLLLRAGVGKKLKIRARNQNVGGVGMI